MGVFRNEFLAALPDEDMVCLRPYLGHFELIHRQTFHQQGQPVHTVLFIETGVISMTAGMEGNETEVGLIGREGIVGTFGLLNPGTYSPHRAICQVPGTGYLASASSVLHCFKQVQSLQTQFMRAIQYQIVQASQVAACNARHALVSRLARWLLMVHDRMDDDTLPLTHAFLAIMLGVRRGGVAASIRTLETQNLISPGHGRITILDRSGLLAVTCDCYRILHDYRRHLYADGSRVAS